MLSRMRRMVAKKAGSEVVWVGKGNQESADKRQKGLWDWGTYKNLKIGLAGGHQFHNAAIALTALEVLKRPLAATGRPPFPWDENALREGLAQVRWPGRMEWVSRDPPILLDGAHNPAGVGLWLILFV